MRSRRRKSRRSRRRKSRRRSRSRSRSRSRRSRNRRRRSRSRSRSRSRRRRSRSTRRTRRRGRSKPASSSKHSSSKSRTGSKTKRTTGTLKSGHSSSKSARAQESATVVPLVLTRERIELTSATRMSGVKEKKIKEKVILHPNDQVVTAITKFGYKRVAENKPNRTAMRLVYQKPKGGSKRVLVEFRITLEKGVGPGRPLNLQFVNPIIEVTFYATSVRPYFTHTHIVKLISTDKDARVQSVLFNSNRMRTGFGIEGVRVMDKEEENYRVYNVDKFENPISDDDEDEERERAKEFKPTYDILYETKGRAPILMDTRLFTNVSLVLRPFQEFEFRTKSRKSAKSGSSSKKRTAPTTIPQRDSSTTKMPRISRNTLEINRLFAAFDRLGKDLKESKIQTTGLHHWTTGQIPITKEEFKTRKGEAFYKATEILKKLNKLKKQQLNRAESRDLNKVISKVKSSLNGWEKYKEVPTEERRLSASMNPMKPILDLRWGPIGSGYPLPPSEIDYNKVFLESIKNT